MKRLGIVEFAICTCLLSAMWAQQGSAPRKTRPSRHDVFHAAKSAGISNPYFARSSNWDTGLWEFGTYPGGSWAAMGHVNNFGVAVGMGDVPPLGPDGSGFTHTFALPLFGPKAGVWMDLGTLGGDGPVGWEEPLTQISDTGIIVGHSTMPSGYVHGFVWNQKSGIVDLGTLADIGYPAYNSSWAVATNNIGTLIVGWSGVEVSCLDCASALPVVWTPSMVWKDGQLLTQWKIHKLPTSGFPKLTRWYVFGVNDVGQIIAVAWNDGETIGIPMLWNPLVSGSGWKVMALPADPDYPYILPFGINDSGLIAAAALSADASIWAPRLWKPLDSKGAKYARPIQLAIPDGFASCESVAVNDKGDITGDCWNDATDLAVRWSSKVPSFSEVLSFPADWCSAFGVNDNGIAVVTYGGGEKCSPDMYGSCGGAIRLH